MPSSCAALCRLRALLHKPQHTPSPPSPTISYPFHVSTLARRPLPVSSAHFNSSNDPHGTPPERQRDRIAQLISLMQCEDADRFAHAFPDSDLDMRIQLPRERAVDALEDLVDFYSRRGKYGSGGLMVWGAWLVQED